MYQFAFQSLRVIFVCGHRTSDQRIWSKINKLHFHLSGDYHRVPSSCELLPQARDMFDRLAHKIENNRPDSADLIPQAGLNCMISQP